MRLISSSGVTFRPFIVRAEVNETIVPQAGNVAFEKTLKMLTAAVPFAFGICQTRQIQGYCLSVFYGNL